MTYMIAHKYTKYDKNNYLCSFKYIHYVNKRSNIGIWKMDKCGSSCSDDRILQYPFYAFFSKKNGRLACFCPILAHYL